MEIIIRATIAYFFLFLMIKALGRKELSEMSPIDMLALIMLGDLVQGGITQEDFSLTGAFLATGTIFFWAFITSILIYRSRKVENLIDGQPLLLMRDGEPFKSVMKTHHITMSFLRETARENGIDDLNKVSAAILEGDGRISFIKADSQP